MNSASDANPAARMVGSLGVQATATLVFNAFIMSRILMSTPLTDAEYQSQTHALLSRIEAQADRWLQDDVIDIDTQRSGGLLELSFPNGSKLIVNTQPPLQEVWLAARGGGFHFRWADGAWRDTRDNSEFITALSQHASTQGGKALNF